MQNGPIPSVKKQIDVAASPDRAFRIFTNDMHRWWPSGCDGSPDDRESIVMEPRNGGRWFEINKRGEEKQWGRVLSWEPPLRVILAWQVRLDKKFDPSLLTEVEIGFLPLEGGRTRVQVEHRKLENFGVQADIAVDAFGGPKAWSGVLAGFSAFASGT